MAGDEPTAAQKAANMAALLRREQTAGQLMQMHPLMAKTGSAILQGVQQGNSQLGEAGQIRYGGALQRGLQDDRQANELDMLGRRQAFDAGEAQKNRDAEAKQGALNRALKRALEGQKQPAGPKPVDFGDKLSLRKEFEGLPEVQQFKQVTSAYGKISKAAENPSPAGDLNLIFGYMKMLDPGSTVREGEFANAQNAGGVDTKVVNLYNQVANGTRLAPEQRADFLKQAADLYGVHAGAYKQARQNYAGLSQRYQIDPQDIVGADIAGLMQPQKPAGGAQAAAPAGAITVTNGKETFQIDPADLADAVKEGFQRVN